MPTKSPEQERLMQAAAHTPGGFGGVPQKVGKEFIGKDDQPPQTELDVAKAIAAGELESPQQYENMMLYALRITGTGIAFRHKHDEYVYRNPDNYLNDEFLDRCAGLPVIWFHPDTDLLTTEEYGKRVIGAIMFAYIIGDEVWGIARINDGEATKELDSKKFSTSPCFTFPVQCYNIANEDYPLMIEGKPVLLDHLAICGEGVWDKGGEPLGVNTQQPVARSDNMDENPEKTPQESDVMTLLKSIVQRLDKLETAEAKEAKGHEEAAAIAGDPEMGKEPIVAADNEQDYQRNVAKADDDDDDDCSSRSDDDDDDSVKELEEKVARSDSEVRDLKAQIKALEARMPRILSDADRNQLSEIQSRADKAASAFGETVAAPLPGETPASYRRRCLDKFKQYSAAWKKIDLSKVTDDILGVAETAIYADAATAAKMPETYGAVGGLREIVKRQRGGGEIVEFVGSQSAWMGDFKAPGNKIAGFSKGF